MVSTIDLLKCALRKVADWDYVESSGYCKKREYQFHCNTFEGENSPLDKAYDAKDWDKCSEEVEKDAEKLMNIYRGESLLRFYDIQSTDTHWHASTEYGQEKHLLRPLTKSWTT